MFTLSHRLENFWNHCFWTSLVFTNIHNPNFMWSLILCTICLINVLLLCSSPILSFKCTVKLYIISSCCYPVLLGFLFLMWTFCLWKTCSVWFCLNEHINTKSFIITEKLRERNVIIDLQLWVIQYLPHKPFALNDYSLFTTKIQQRVSLSTTMTENSGTINKDTKDQHNICLHSYCEFCYC